jgi:hypothetical protein
VGEILDSVPGLSTNDATSLIGSWLVLAWVLTVEVWHWLIRTKTKMALEFLDELRENYSLRPLQPQPTRRRGAAGS